jgi:hypothetical protein
MAKNFTSPDGVPYEFPDDVTPEEINQFLSGISAQTGQQPTQQPMQQDAQQQMQSMGQPDNYDSFLSKLDFTRNLPTFGNDQQKQPGVNPLFQSIQDKSPGSIKALENLLTAITLFNPAMEGSAALINGAPAAIAKYGKPVAMAGKSLAKHFMPETSGEEFRATLGQGTSEQNIEELARRIQLGEKVNKADALSHSDIVDNAVGKANIENVPSHALPEGNLEEVAKIFNKDQDYFDSNAIKELSKALSKFRKTGDVDSFIETGEDIFKPSQELTKKDYSTLEDMLSIPTKRETKYINNVDEYMDYYSPTLKKYHNEYVNKPTYKNSRDLQIKLNKEMSPLLRQAGKDNLDNAGREKLDALKYAESLIKHDQDSFLEYFDPALKQQNEIFRQKWSENVKPYHSSDLLTRITKQDRTSGIEPSELDREFGFPDKEAQKIAEDIGPSGTGNILYNQLQKVKPNDVEGLIEALQEAERTQGYGRYIDSGMKETSKQIQKQMKNKNIGLSALAAALGAAGGGIPGAMAGGGSILAYKYATPIARKLLETTLKRK